MQESTRFQNDFEKYFSKENINKLKRQKGKDQQPLPLHTNHSNDSLITRRVSFLYSRRL